MLSAKHGNEILVAKLRLRPVSFRMMLERGAALDIHVAWIPFAVERGHGINAPVEKDSELGVAVPPWDSISAERVPVWVEGTGRRLLHACELAPHRFIRLLRRALHCAKKDAYTCDRIKSTAACRFYGTLHRLLPGLGALIL